MSDCLEQIALPEEDFLKIFREFVWRLNSYGLPFLYLLGRRVTLDEVTQYLRQTDALPALLEQAGIAGSRLRQARSLALYPEWFYEDLLELLDAGKASLTPVTVHEDVLQQERNS